MTKQKQIDLLMKLVDDLRQRIEILEAQVDRAKQPLAVPASPHLYPPYKVTCGPLDPVPVIGPGTCWNEKDEPPLPHVAHSTYKTEVGDMIFTVYGEDELPDAVVRKSGALA